MKPLRVNRFDENIHEPQPYLLTELVAKDDGAMYEFSALDSEGGAWPPPGFAVILKKGEVERINIRGHVSPSLIVAALEYVTQNEDARRELADARAMTLEHKAN